MIFWLLSRLDQQGWPMQLAGFLASSWRKTKLLKQESLGGRVAVCLRLINGIEFKLGVTRGSAW